MFFEGTLQEGISTAVGQQKLVLCFVTDENEEANTWENEFLTDSSLSELIKTQAVALRLVAGSEEAGYLSQIFPLPKAPTMVIMKHGELKEYITPGASKEDFLRRVQGAFSAAAKPAPPSTSPSASAPAASSSVPEAESSPASSSTESQQSQNVRRILAERAAKLQAHKEEAERKAKDDRAKARARAKAEAEAGASTEAATRHKATELVKSQKQKSREERQRVLKRIEDDKEERRVRAAEREKLRIESQTVGDVAASLVSSPQTKLPSTTKVGEMAYIQVRLFDGSSIRARLKTGSPLRDVRTWVDGDRTDGNMPYRFKQVLSPQSHQAIDDTEEDKSLGDLGLAPSATLVLTPVPKYSSAFRVGSGNIVSQVIEMIMAILMWILSLVGLGRRRVAQEPDDTEQEDSTDADMSRMRGLNDRRRDQQFYNGNSLSFEPRPDEDDK